MADQVQSILTVLSILSTMTLQKFTLVVLFRHKTATRRLLVGQCIQVGS